MEPVTHILTGVCLAKAGFNRRAAYATLAMAVAAELPDIDTLWSLRGPVEGFAHHRGITHTFVGLPFEAAFVVATVYGLHRWRLSRAAKVPLLPDRVRRPLTKAPVRWGYLYVCVLIGLLSHLLLDYTNNYGLRPFFPFNTHWYAASITFIFDPVMFAPLLMALVVPPLLGMVSAEVGAKRNPFRGRGLAITALICVFALWSLRFVEHQSAEQLALQQTYELQQQPTEVPIAETAPVSTGTSAPVKTTNPDEGASVTSPQETELVQPPGQLLKVQRVQASPDPVNPFHWAVTMDFGQLYQLADVDTLAADVTPSELTYPKLVADAVVRTAEKSPVGRVYLDWSSMPILTEEQTVPANPASRPMRKVTFRDPRFMGDVTWLRSSGAPPLTAVATVDDSGVLVRESLDGRREVPGRAPVSEVNWQPYLAALWVKVTASSPKPPVKRSAPVVMTAAKPVLKQPMVVPSAPIVSPPVAPPAATTAPPMPMTSPVVAPPMSSAPARVESVKPVVVAPKAPVEVPKPASMSAPVAAPALPVAKATVPQPVTVRTPPVVEQKRVEPAKAVPAKTGPSIFERGEDKASAQYQRFRNWIRWLTNTK